MSKNRNPSRKSIGIAAKRYATMYYASTGFWYVIDTDLNLAVRIRRTKEEACSEMHKVVEEYAAFLDGIAA